MSRYRLPNGRFRKGSARARECGRKGGGRSAKNPRQDSTRGPLGPKAATQAPVAAFRAFWRDWLMTPEVVDYIKWAATLRIHDERGNLVPAAGSVALLGRLMDKCHPTPQSVKLQDDGERPIRILVGSAGREIELPYIPKTPLVIPTNGGEGNVH